MTLFVGFVYLVRTVTTCVPGPEDMLDLTFKTNHATLFLDWGVWVGEGRQPQPPNLLPTSLLLL